MDWLDDLVHAPAAAFPLVRVVVAAIEGSAPREAGTVMRVGLRSQHGTIGGGALEWEAASLARAMLAGDPPGGCVVTRVLGPDVGQCCGGVVSLWIERIASREQALFRAALAGRASGCSIESVLDAKGRVTRRLVTHAPRAANDHEAPSATLRPGPDGGHVLLEAVTERRTPLWLFGAGHVGRALVRVLADLPFRVQWIDSREEAFPLEHPSSVTMRTCVDPVDAVREMPIGALALVMTHSHPLDYRLCEALLARGSVPRVGLIGSRTKAARFRSRLRRDPACAPLLDRLVSPIGMPGITGKEPAVIAVSVAAQLLAWRSSDDVPAIMAGKVEAQWP